MLLALTFTAAAIFGWRRARRRGGTTADAVQYALAHAIPATLLMLAAQILVIRLGLIG
ncbi:MAG: hypothetical protein ACFBRM_00180 [Pikeienuella sp.]